MLMNLSGSVVVVGSTLTKLNWTLYLSAPGAYWFGAPFALSNKEVSSSEVTIDSTIFKPISQLVIVFEFVSTIIVCDAQSTNRSEV